MSEICSISPEAVAQIHLRQILFFTKVASLRPATLLKKRLFHRCFPVNFAKFLRTPFLQNTSSGCFCSMETSLFSNALKTGVSEIGNTQDKD